MNNSELLKALDNENNKGVMKLSSDKIYKDKNDIFNQLYLTHEDKKKLTNKLMMCLTDKLMILIFMSK